MNAYYIRHFLASLAFPEEAISRVRHKFVLTLPAGDVEGWFFPLQPLLQDRDCKQHRAGDENHCSGKVEAGIIVAQSVVKSSCKELHKDRRRPLDRMTCHIFPLFLGARKRITRNVDLNFSFEVALQFIVDFFLRSTFLLRLSVKCEFIALIV